MKYPRIQPNSVILRHELRQQSCFTKLLQLIPITKGFTPIGFAATAISASGGIGWKLP